jgi:hypothetical protein
MSSQTEIKFSIRERPLKNDNITASINRLNDICLKQFMVQYFQRVIKMEQKIAKKTGKNFIRVYLHSGTRGNPLGDEELAIFCQCNSDAPSVDDVDTKRLVRWVNSNPECRKNQSNESYIVSEQIDSIATVFLSPREIQCCHNANRIFPRLVSE